MCGKEGKLRKNTSIYRGLKAPFGACGGLFPDIVRSRRQEREWSGTNGLEWDCKSCTGSLRRFMEDFSECS
jgi:hypothetical protein